MKEKGKEDGGEREVAKDSQGVELIETSRCRDQRADRSGCRLPVFPVRDRVASDGKKGEFGRCNPTVRAQSEKSIAVAAAPKRRAAVTPRCVVICSTLQLLPGKTRVGKAHNQISI